MLGQYQDNSRVSDPAALPKWLEGIYVYENDCLSDCSDCLFFFISSINAYSSFGRQHALLSNTD